MPTLKEIIGALNDELQKEIRRKRRKKEEKKKKKRRKKEEKKKSTRLYTSVDQSEVTDAALRGGTSDPNGLGCIAK